MVNVATARFFNSPFNLEKLISNFESEETRNTFYDALPHAEYQVRFNKIGEPFKIVADVMDYNAGYITWKNKRWFFFVDYWNVVNENIIEINYTIDAWETYAYSTEIKFGTYHAYRTSYEEKGQYKNYFAPIYTISALKTQFIKSFPSSSLTVFFVVYDDTNNKARYGWFGTWPGALLSGQAVLDIVNKLKGQYGLSDNIRLISAFVSPFYDDAIDDPVGMEQYYLKLANNLYLALDSEVGFSPSHGINIDIENDRYTTFKILDNSGVEIWRASDKRHYTRINASLNASFAGASWRCALSADDTLYNETFTFPLIPIDIISDAWAQYYVQRRNYDVQTRQIASQQQLVNGVVGNAIGGGIAGATVNPVGALAGAVGGAIGSVIGYATDTAIFNPKIQNATDELYKKASDTLNLVGEGYLYLFRCGVYREFWDSETQTKNDTAISENGYINDEYGENYNFQNGPFAGDIQITGIPRVASNQIRQRLVNGVIFNKGD